MKGRAVRAALDLAEELGIDAPEHLDLDLVAAHLGVFTQSGALADEEAYLVRRGDRGLVTLAERVRGSYKGRFVLAHEIGHFLLHPALDEFARCTGIGVRQGDAPAHEAEANAFAAELLFLRPLFAPLCARPRPTLHHVSSLADRFRASLTATALRYVRFATAPCAVVCSKGGEVAWWKGSPSFRGRLARGQRVGSAAFARLVFARERPPDLLLPVDPGAWGLPKGELREHARAVDPGRVALSMLVEDAR